MTGKLFTKGMKLAEIIHADYRLLYVLPRFGIKLGFGDITVAEACKKNHANEDLFVLACNIYAFGNYMPRIGDIGHIPLGDITAYLQHSHSDYLDKRIPHIIRHIEHLADKSYARNRNIIKQFCENYRKEVTAHFDYEEQVVFPYIDSLTRKQVEKQFKIDDFLQNHSNIEDKLNDLKNIIMKYIEPNADDEDNRDLLIDLFLLEEDLERHTIIEEKVLVALVEVMEQSSR